MELKDIAKVREEFAEQASILSRNLNEYVVKDVSIQQPDYIPTNEWTENYNKEKQVIGRSGLLNFPLCINGFNAIAGVIYANIKILSEKTNAEQCIYILKGFLKDYTNNREYIFPNVLIIPPNEQIEYEAKHKVMFVKLIKPTIQDYIPTDILKEHNKNAN